MLDCLLKVIYEDLSTFDNHVVTTMQMKFEIMWLEEERSTGRVIPRSNIFEEGIFCLTLCRIRV